MTSATFDLSAENELTIEWIIGSSFPQFCQNYTIRIELTLKECGIFDCTIKISVPVSNLTLTRTLEACASYDIKIFETENKEATIAKEDFKTNEMFQKIEPDVRQVNSTVLRVFWSYNNHPFCPKKFQIQVFFQDDVIFKSLEVVTTSAGINDLEPCETYRITVHPMKESQVLTPLGGVLNYTMKSEMPTSIRDFKLEYIEVGESIGTINVSWYAPVFAAKCISNYFMETESRHDNGTRNVSGLNTFNNVEITNVLACIDYTIKITINTLNGKSGEANVKEIYVPSRVFRAPSPPRVLDTTHNSVTLSVSVDENSQRNYCAISRARFRCKDGLANPSVIKTVTTTTYELENLKPYTNYACFARIENQDNFGDNSEFSPESEFSYVLTKETCKHHELHESKTY